jgi:DNA repair exonuclease SbcCD nuclease subunit
MKFAHISDTHLGASNFKLKEREEDFENAFKNAVDKIIEEKVDFVVHSGDLFDRGRPPLKTFLFCLDQLKRLKKANIPVFIVAGSHDIGSEGTQISIFEEVDLIKNVSPISLSGDVIEKIEGVTLKLKDIDVFICGISGRRAKINEIYEKFNLEPPKNAYKIFVFHHIVSDVPNATLFYDIQTSLLPRGFDYYAAGHWHSRFEKKFDHGIIVYPGSLEYCDIREMETDKEKGFYIVEVNEKKETRLKWIKIEMRKILIRSLNCNNFSPSEVTENCIKLIKEEAANIKNGILILELNGRLKSGNKSEIDRIRIEKLSKELGILITQVYTSNLLDPSSSMTIDVKSKSLEEIEIEYLQKQKYDDKVIKLAKELISILGQDLSSEEIEREVERAYNIIQKEMLK